MFSRLPRMKPCGVWRRSMHSSCDVGTQSVRYRPGFALEFTAWRHSPRIMTLVSWSVLVGIPISLVTGIIGGCAFPLTWGVALAKAGPQ